MGANRAIKRLLAALTVTFLLTGCAAGATLSPSASAAPTTSGAATTPGPTPTPVPVTPVPSPLTGFATAIPPAADQPWTGITWRSLTPEDPLRDVRSAVRWDGGFVAFGIPVVTDGSSRTPLWRSSDGANWSALDPGALGTSTVVLDAVATTDGLAALTLQGGSSTCTSDELRNYGLDCLTLAPPLQVFTSPDGIRWTAHAGPDLPLQAEYGGDSGWPYAPRLVAGEPGLLAYTWERPTLDASRPTARLASARVPALPAAPGPSSTEAQGPCRLAHSADGVEWETLPADVSPAGFVCTGIAPIAGGFAAVGLLGENRAGSLWSADGRAWEPATMPTVVVGHPLDLAAASGGLVASGVTGDTPGGSFWLSSTDGRRWATLQGFQPLGTWENPGGADPGLVPDGDLVADGVRFVAYRGGTTPGAWTSFDGLTWQPVAVTPTTPSEPGRLLATTIGTLWIGEDGSAWFGEPTAR